MAYKVIIRPLALKALKKIPELDQRRILKRVDSLAIDPRPAGMRKLRGVKDLYRIRAGDYRVVYQIQDFILVVIVVQVSHRKDAYKN